MNNTKPLDRLWLAIVLLIPILIPISPSIADEEVSVTRKFSGKVADAELKALHPFSGTIVDANRWKELWTAWRPDQAVPQIDFQTELVIVNIARGPNTVFANTLKIDDQSNLKFEVASTRMAGPGFGYLIMVIPKSGIKSVNGVALDAKPPTIASPANQNNIDTRAVGKESVTVEIVGGVRTGIPSTGVETTGNLIAANNIVWELDFQNKEALLKSAMNVGDSLARVKGELVMERGTDARSRFIVQVESIERLDLVPPPNAYSDRGDRQIVNNKRKDLPANQPAAETVPSTNEDNMEPTPLNPIDNPPALNSFDVVSLVTSDGQTQTIDQNGKVIYSSTAKNTTNEWSIKPNTLAKLHRFVAETDWSSVPRDIRGRNSEEELSFMISVESAQSVTRIYIDSSRVAEQAKMKEFFELIRQVGADRK